MQNEKSTSILKAMSLTMIVVMPVAEASGTGQVDVDGISIGELSQVQSETFLLRAKAEREKARNAASESPSKNTTSGAMPASSWSPAAVGSSVSLPVVRMVYMSGKVMQAKLLFSSGIEIDASTGTDIPGGFKVAGINLDGVVLTRNGQRYPLGFSNRAPASTAEVNLAPQPVIGGAQ
ncbi:type IV pilus biogenesis protein PilP [Pseudomonas cichorii]|nr:type IV pilus biogenesis protein PilP [Pseudomonas cichorii]